LILAFLSRWFSEVSLDGGGGGPKVSDGERGADGVSIDGDQFLEETP
jgi:hypothetical protein